MASMLMSVVGWGCATPPTEVDPTGLYGCNDLELDPPNVFEEPVGNSDDDDIIESNEPFTIRWFANFHKGYETTIEGAVDYIAAVTILEDDVEVFYEEIDAQVFGVSGGGWDDVFVGSGLPAGNYVVRVILDTNNDVAECQDLPYVLNNVREVDLAITNQPIDDKVTPPDSSPDNGASRDPSRGESPQRG